MKRHSYAAAVLLGLIVAQILATIHVHLSNVRLYRTLLAVSDAGYLTIPNQRIMPTLQGFVPAFFGALFFTLSVGACLALLTLAAVWLWDHLFYRNKLVSIVLVAIWAGCLLMVNIRGIDLLVSAYFLFVPFMALFVSLRRMPSESSKRKWRQAIVYVGPVLFLAALWFTQMDSNLFLDIRDHLLLSNRFGTKINDFYYKYTLYPAEVFKSLDQKVLKTYHLEHIQDNSMGESIKRQLVSHDYLRVKGDSPVDLTIYQSGAFLVFKKGERNILKVTPQSFFSNPGKLLREFSEKSDKHRFFRRFTFFSLLVGFPIALYILLLSSFREVMGLFLSMRISSVCASAICVALGIALFVAFHHSRMKSTEVQDVAAALESERWQERVEALKLMEKRGIEVSGFPAYRSMLKSPCIPVRYWLVRALGVSREPETYNDLLGFLDDPHPNVVSMAFYALGKRGEQSAVGVILKRIEASQHWYNQWYAYKALRRLGWKQTGLR